MIVVGMVYQLLSLQGTVNQITEAFGGDPVAFLQKPEWFRFIYVASEACQIVCWGTILFLAALTAVEDALYEVSRIYDLNRWQPSLLDTFTIIHLPTTTLMILTI